jgi:hypothetical protein
MDCMDADLCLAEWIPITLPSTLPSIMVSILCFCVDDFPYACRTQERIILGPASSPTAWASQ